MKGYFSKLAKQSALQYAKGNTASSSLNAKKKAEEIAPFHREETFLVSPMPEAFENLSPPKNDPAGKNSVEFPANELLNPPFDATRRKGFSGINEQGETSVEPRQIKLDKWNSAKSPAVEQTIFEENETAETIAGESAGAASRQNFHPAESRHQAGDKTIEETSVQPEFFNKTAEILESGTADKSEVRQILLQEINEWVNAAPALSEAENELSTENEAHAILPSMVKHKSPESAAKGSDNLEEQNFNLSIGTITVVIEEPDNQPKIATENQNRSAEKSKPEETGFSRLSRYYL